MALKSSTGAKPFPKAHIKPFDLGNWDASNRRVAVNDADTRPADYGSAALDGLTVLICTAYVFF
jgi:hypothetical protein